MALGTAAVPMPEVNIGSAFSAAADAALNTTLSPPFTPYLTQDNDLVFLHGAQKPCPLHPRAQSLALLDVCPQCLWVRHLFVSGPHMSSQPGLHVCILIHLQKKFMQVPSSSRTLV